MKIEIAPELGFCSGVKRALKILKTEIKKCGNLETLGAVVHNSQVMGSLAEMGVRAVASLADIQGNTVVIPSHGVAPEIYTQLRSQRLKIIDATCPIVRRAQREAGRLGGSGFAVIIFGDAGHPEVRGLLGWAGEGSLAVSTAEEVAKPSSLPHRLAIISQTTQSRGRFTQFVKQITEKFQFQELRVVNTLCPTTQRRQEVAVELARRNDLMLVIGGHNSANSRQLTEICSSLAETHLVESVGEIDKTWLGEKKTGIIAGASTSEETINEVISWLRSSHLGA